MEQLNLNLIPNGTMPVCHVSQYDVGRTIRLNLFEGASVFAFDGTETAEVHVRKPDGNIVTAALTVAASQTYVEVVTTEQMDAVAGSNICEIQIIKSGDVIGSLNFIMEVEADPMDEGVESDSVIHNLQARVNAATLNTPLAGEVEGTRNLMLELFDDNFGIEEDVKLSGYNANNTSLSNENMPFVLARGGTPQLLEEVIITKIKIKVVTAGSISIGIVLPSDLTTYDPSKFIVKDVLTINEAGLQTVVLKNPFIVPTGYAVFLGFPDEAVRFNYGPNGIDTGFIYRSGTSFGSTSSSLNIDFYGIPKSAVAWTTFIDELEDVRNGEDGFEYDTAGNAVRGQYTTNRNLIKALDAARFGSDELTVVDAYDSRNASLSNINMPFIYKNQGDLYHNVLITKIKIKVYTPGRLDIGYIKTSDVTTYDESKCIVTNTLIANEGGEQIFTLKNPFVVPDDSVLFFGLPNDDNTMRFIYGTYGTDLSFFFRSPSEGDVYVESPNSLNINIFGIDINVSFIKSIYSGKTLSILGDSISTFAGYIPEGNAAYYPAGTVQVVTDTWWYKLLTALGLTLNVNNSWSGSRVTTTAGETSAGCMTRCQNLGTAPDVIIVWMGINDFNNEVALGTYDGKSAVPATTTTFREAYGIMLNKILTAYPTAEVWVCTLPQCERNGSANFPEINGNNVPLADFNEAIVELANAFGVKILDHNKCGLTYQNMSVYNPDELHPNKFGHSLVANNDIRQMDGFVRKRYPTS